MTDTNIIIENYKEIDGLRNNPQIVLKVNNKFKELGFKKVVINGYLGDTTIEKELTLYINPNVTEFMYKSWRVSTRINNYDDYDCYDYLRDYSSKDEEIKIGGCISFMFMFIISTPLSIMSSRS